METKQSREPGAKLIIGWREVIAIPEWGIEALEAKADTGARTSALDVTQIDELSADRVRFQVALRRRKRKRRKSVEAPITRRSRIRSSNGQMEERLMVVATVKIGAIEKPVEFGLVCRKNMICRALLGRSALEGDFLVDPSIRHVFDDDSCDPEIEDGAR